MDDFLMNIFGVGSSIGIVLLVAKSMVSSRRQMKHDAIRERDSWKKIRQNHSRGYSNSHDDDDAEYDDEDDDDLRERERQLSRELKAVRNRMKGNSARY